MRFWRSLGMLALAMIVLGGSARAQGQPPAPSTPPAPAAPPPATGTGAPPATTPAPTATPAPKPNAKAPRSSQSRIPTRRSWMMGFSYGYGSANFIGAGKDAFVALPPDGFSDQSRESAPLVQFRFAYAISHKVAVGFERIDWSKKINGDQWKLSATTAMGTWFPTAGGWYLRGGWGVASAHDKHFPVEDSNANIQYSDDGFAFVGGAGYEYRLWKRWSLALQADYVYGALGENTAFNYPLGSLGLNWWF